MNITRRQAAITAASAPFAVSYALAALQNSSVGRGEEPEPDHQFTDPPSQPSDAELVILGAAVEAARHRSASELVRDERFLSLHPQPVFRELVKAVAREPALTIPRDDEPGARIVVTGAVTGPSGAPVVGAVVYAYHTSEKGWYSDRAAHVRAWAGDTRHARLFGYLKTGPDGSFEIRTIRPGGYPRSTLPQHIHIEVSADGFAPLVTELLFDDDPRLTADQRDRAKRAGFLVAASAADPAGGPTFHYSVSLKQA